MKKIRHIIAAILVLCMMYSIVPSAVFATDDDPTLVASETETGSENGGVEATNSADTNTTLDLSTDTSGGELAGEENGDAKPSNMSDADSAESEKDGSKDETEDTTQDTTQGEADDNEQSGSDTSGINPVKEEIPENNTAETDITNGDESNPNPVKSDAAGEEKEYTDKTAADEKEPLRGEEDDLAAEEQQNDKVQPDEDSTEKEDISEEKTASNILDALNQGITAQIIGGTAFPEGVYASVRLIGVDEQAGLKGSLDEYLKDKNAVLDQISFGVDIGIYNADGSKYVPSGAVTVKVYMDGSSLQGTRLYHLKNDGIWEELNYTINGATEQEPAFVGFTTASFSPFLFGSVNEAGEMKASAKAPLKASGDEQTPGGLIVELDFDTLDGIVAADTYQKPFIVTIKFEGLTSNKQYSYTRKGPNFNVTETTNLGPENDTLNLTMRSYESVTIEGLPAGVSYTVTEELRDYYTKLDYNNEPVYDENQSGTIESRVNSETVIVNSPKVYSWSLTKNVVGAYDGQKFQFTFSFQDDYFRWGEKKHYYYINGEPYELKVTREFDNGEKILGDTVLIENGDTIFVPDLLSTHHYYYYEGSNPAGYNGYVASSGAIRADLKVLCKDSSRYIGFRKLDQYGNHVAGATLQVLDSDKEVLLVFETTDKDYYWNPPYSIYGKQLYLHEASAPEGYFIAEDIPFVFTQGQMTQYITYRTSEGADITANYTPYSVTVNGEEQENNTLVMTDKATEVRIRKVDVADGKELEGAHIQILDSRGTVVEEWDSTTETHVVTALKRGERYTLHETVAPDGYSVTSDTNFIIDATGKVTSTGNTTTDEDGNTVLLVEDEQAHSLTINKKYDDNGTKAVLNPKSIFGFQVVIKNIPLVYMTAGLDTSEAYIKNYGNPNIQEWLDNSAEYYPKPETDSKITHIGPDPNVSYNNFFRKDSGSDTCFTSFIVWLGVDESFTVFDLPKGATYEVQEVAGYYNNGPPSSERALFDIEYSNNKAGTVGDDDINVTVTNVLRTIDLIASKEVLGYDNGKKVYLRYESAINSAYESANQTFIDCDGAERSLFYILQGSVPYTVGLIPLEPNGGDTVIKLPMASHWFIEEYVLKADVDPDDYSYENLVSAVWPHTGFMPVMFAHGKNDSDSGYYMIYYPTTSGSNRIKDFVLRYKNASRLIAFQKIDEDGNPVSGAQMQILDKESGDVLFDWISDADHPYELNTKDAVKFKPEWFSNKTFVLHEEESPTGYAIAEDIEFTVEKHEGTTQRIDDDGSVLGEESYYYPYIDTGDGKEILVLQMVDELSVIDVSVSKIDVADSKELSGAKLQVLDADGKVVDEWTSTEETHKVSGLKVTKTYTLHEEVAPDGYLVTADTTFTIDETGKVTSTGTTTTDKDGNTVLLVEDAITSVKISKVDVADGKELEGAKIQILDSKGEIVEEWTSGKEAHEVTGLKTGETYTLHEEVAPDGYTIASDTTFTIDKTGKVTSTGTTTTDKDGNTVLLVEDAITSVKISKVDVADGKELEGAKIQILDKSGKAVEEWTSTKEVHIVEGLKTGETYTLHEEVAPDGYTITSDTTFTIDKTGKVTTTGATTTDEDGNTVLLVEDAITSVKISKVDVADGKELEGAKIQILDSKGTVVEKWVSTKETHEVKGLKTGETYTLHEEVAPDGYTIASDTTFTIDETGKVTTTGTTTTDEDGNTVLLVEDTKTSVYISKVDVADGKELEGATIQILDSKGTVVEKWVSTKEIHEVKGLKTGEAYTLHEEVAPDGYTIASDTTFTIDKTGKVTTTGATTKDKDGNTVLLVEDAITSVRISKVDVADGKELEGATIQILDSKGTVVEEWISSKEAHEVKGLKTGEKYTLRETVAPDGYSMTADTTFTIDKNGKVTSTGTTTTDKDGNTVLLVEDTRIAGGVYVSKVDVADGKELEGAKIQILDSKKKVVEEWVSTKTAHMLRGLIAGEKYTLHETVAPNGYALTADITFTIDEAGKVTTAGKTKKDAAGNTILLVEDKRLQGTAGIAPVKTGDPTNFPLLIGILAAGAAALIVLLVLKKKKDGEKE